MHYINVFKGLTDTKTLQNALQHNNNRILELLKAIMGATILSFVVMTEGKQYKYCSRYKVIHQEFVLGCI